MASQELRNPSPATPTARGQTQRVVAEYSSEPIFFFDGGFKTWAQIVQRTLLNSALAGHAVAATGTVGRS